MAKANNKTQANDASPTEFIATIENAARREDAEAVLAMMTEVTGEQPRMWGTAIIGFGEYHTVYESGRELDWFYVGFSPRKRELVLYIMPGFSGYPELMARLGKHKTGKSCLYIKRLSDLDLDVLRELIAQSVDYMREKYRQET